MFFEKYFFVEKSKEWKFQQNENRYWNQGHFSNEEEKKKKQCHGIKENTILKLNKELKKFSSVISE